MLLAPIWKRKKKVRYYSIIRGLNISHDGISAWVPDRSLRVSGRGKEGSGKQRPVLCGFPLSPGMAQQDLLMAIHRQVGSGFEGAILNLWLSFLLFLLKIPLNSP